MKKLLLFLICLATLLNVQAQNTDYANRMQHIFGNIDKTKVTTGYLKEFGIRFNEVEAYNGVINTTNYVDKTQWQSLYSSLYTMRVGTAAQGMAAPASVFNTLKNAQANTTDILLATQHYNYQQYKTTALTHGDVQVLNERIYDVAGRNPYDTQTVFAVTPLQSVLNGNSFSFKLPSNLVYKNTAQNPTLIQIDFGNGQGYQTISFNQGKSVTYTSGGEKELKVKFTYANGTTLYSHSKLLVNYIAPAFGSAARYNGFGLLFNNFPITGAPYLGASATGLVTVELAPGHTQLTKPLIVVEGFDPDNSFDYFSFINNRNLGGINVDLDTSTSFYSLNEAIEDEDYDLVFVNYANGTDYIQRNAYMLEAVLQWVNGLKTTAGSTEQNVVLGMSMGGLVARYALRHMEIDNDPNTNHDTKLYISHDSPHQGANMPVAAQAFVRHIIGEQVNIPIFFSLFGADVIPMGDILPEELQEGFEMLNSPAAQQMLIYQLQGTGSNISVTNNSLFNSFSTEYTSMGYPQQNGIRNIAIANGSECGTPLNFSPYATLANVEETISLPGWSQIVMAVYHALAINPGKLLSTVFSTDGDIKARFVMRALPNQQSKEIYKGEVFIRKTILFVIEVHEDLIDEKALNSTSSMLPLDSASGGVYNIDTFFDLPAEFDAALLQRRFNFIPTYSSLDIGGGTQSIYYSDLNKKYSPLSPPAAPKNVPFDNFFTNSITSENHTQFTLNNGTWLVNELADTPEILSCSFACEDNINNIVGTNLVCNSNTASFSAPAGGTFYNWQIIDGSHLIASSSGSNMQNFTLTTSATGYGRLELQVTMGDDPNNTGNGRCGNVTFTKAIWVGKPSFAVLRTNDYCEAGKHFVIYQITEPENYNFNYTYSLIYPTNQGGVASINGKTISIYFPSGYSNSMLTFSVRTSNSCGITNRMVEDEINPCSSFARTIDNESTYSIYPNPSKDIVTIDLRDQNNKPKKGTIIYGELFDLMGLSRARVEIIDNKATFSVTDLPKGIYVLKIYINNQIESYQIAVE